MSGRLYDAVARVARHEAQARATASIGVVTDVHKSALGADHAVDVELRDRGLVLPRVPIAVGALGFVATPAVGDLVVVVFADGDMHAPVVVGRLYSSDLPPPEHGDGQAVLHLPPGDASAALQAVIDGTAPSLELQVGGDTRVRIGDGEISLTSGDAEVRIDAGGAEEVKVRVGDASMTISARGDVTLEAANKLSIEATEIELKGSAGVKINGALVEIN